ncbi:MAG: glucose-1-phosphate thymidylyltransferase [Bacteroidota bacterium]|nr:glucose-1-phosphate thymidylyltransferase [Bacteroidota bacterium]
MAIILFDNCLRHQLYPLTATRAVADIRLGILTAKEWWQHRTQQQVYVITEDYLMPLYENLPKGEHVLVDASLFPFDDMLERILELQTGTAIVDEKGIVAGKLNVYVSLQMNDIQTNLFSKIISSTETFQRLEYPWQIFQWNDEVIRSDFKLITAGRTSMPISATNHTVQAADIFIEEGAKVEFAFLNASAGPIYIGKNAEVWEGACIRGPFALGENSVVKMGAKIYGATTIGPWCAAGGEIKNVVMTGYSNKAHDGYLGDSVIGEWCNLGAGTSNSNVKNTGGPVKMWNAFTQHMEIAGNKAGVIMGDYSRTAINSSINTGSIIGVCANVFANGLLPKVIDSCTWGITETYDFQKALEDIANWKRMKHCEISDEEVQMLQHIFAAGKGK